MRKLIIFLLLVESSVKLFSQTDSTDNYVKNFQSVPSINVNIVPDSSVYNNENLRKGVPFILMFFNPDCDHCQKETKELLAYKQELKDIPILMVSSSPFQSLKDFYDNFGLSSVPNIKLGQDVNSRLGSIYKLRIFPSIFVYDNRGILAKAFVGNIGIPAIVNAVK